MTTIKRARKDLCPLSEQARSELAEAWGYSRICPEPYGAWAALGDGVRGALIDSTILSFVLRQVDPAFAPAQAMIRDMLADLRIR